MRIIWILLCLALVLFWLAFPLIAVKQPPPPSKLGVVEGSRAVELQPLHPGLYFYVYDDEKHMWNRAREETLITAVCENIRTLSVINSE